MIQLSNGATLHAAFILPEGNSLKPHGVALAETPTDWAVWNIFWDGEWVDLDENGSHEVWESTNGHYFSKNNSANLTADSPRRLAQLQFGRSMRRLVHTDIQEGMNQR